jgi:hypothetical protein
MELEPASYRICDVMSGDENICTPITISVAETCRRPARQRAVPAGITSSPTELRNTPLSLPARDRDFDRPDVGGQTRITAAVDATWPISGGRTQPRSDRDAVLRAEVRSVRSGHGKGGVQFSGVRGRARVCSKVGIGVTLEVRERAWIGGRDGAECGIF